MRRLCLGLGKRVILRGGRMGKIDRYRLLCVNESRHTFNGPVLSRKMVKIKEVL